MDEDPNEIFPEVSLSTLKERASIWGGRSPFISRIVLYPGYESALMHFLVVETTMDYETRVKELEQIYGTAGLEELEKYKKLRRELNREYGTTSLKEVERIYGKEKLGELEKIYGITTPEDLGKYETILKELEQKYGITTLKEFLNTSITHLLRDWADDECFGIRADLTDAFKLDNPRKTNLADFLNRWKCLEIEPGKNLSPKLVNEKHACLLYSKEDQQAKTESILPPNLIKGWKAIANFLGVSEKTAKSYHYKRQMPVRKFPKGAVGALPEELTKWLSSQFNKKPTPRKV